MSWVMIGLAMSLGTSWWANIRLVKQIFSLQEELEAVREMNRHLFERLMEDTEIVGSDKNNNVDTGDNIACV